MSDDVEKTKRTSLTWNPELKDSVNDLKDAVQRLTNKPPTNLEIFMLCLGVGFSNGKKNAVPPRKSDVTNVKYIQEMDLANIRAIALDESKDPTILLREDDVYDIAEQYASGGLEILASEMGKQPDFQSWLTSRFWKALNANES